MNINIFGSTGTIGTKTLKIIEKYYPFITINLLTANSNYKKFIYQIKKYKPKAVFIKNEKYFNILKKNINYKLIYISNNEIHDYLNSTKTNLTLLAISGIDGLDYLDSICKNTSNLGLVNKESIVSAGHLLNSILKKNKTNLFPLDSEHFSLFNSINKLSEYNKIYLTASGGPFLKSSYNVVKNATFEKATKHPKWKMGYKNSIDSATLVNKILEIIEAKYLFNIPLNKLDILIHPEALIHSVIEHNNFTSTFNYFYPDMAIPIINFLNIVNKNNSHFESFNIKKFNLKKNETMNFLEVDNNKFPIYYYFRTLDFNSPKNIIKFNISNQYAVDLFKDKKIIYGDIVKNIAKFMKININSPVNSVENVINFHYDFKRLLLNSKI